MFMARSDGGYAGRCASLPRPASATVLPPGRRPLLSAAAHGVRELPAGDRNEHCVTDLRL